LLTFGLIYRAAGLLYRPASNPNSHDMMFSRFRAPVLLLALGALIWPVTGVAADAVVHHPGKFAWAEVVTTDPAAVVAFYTKTFGWTARKADHGPEGYTLLFNAGRPVGAVAYRPADAGSKAPGGARWVGFISVAEIDQAVAAVTAAGGRTLVAPHQVEGRGTQAVVTDAEGSVFGLIVTAAGDAPKGKVADNDWAWVQLLASKPADAAAFYGKALGYVVTDDARTTRSDDFLLTREGVPYAGLTALPEGRNGRGGWLGYVKVAEVQATVDAAKALGAQVLFAPQTVPGAMQVAIITDPLGGAIGLVSVSAQATGEVAQ
jgi:predicted enzyme related to lactoylglutathione lyase